MKFCGNPVYEDQYAVYYGGFENSKKQLFKIFDYVKFIDVKSGLSYIGKIQSPFYDKVDQKNKTEVQLFYDSLTKVSVDKSVFSEFYSSTKFVEIEIDDILEHVKLVYIPSDKDLVNVLRNSEKDEHEVDSSSDCNDDDDEDDDEDEEYVPDDDSIKDFIIDDTKINLIGFYRKCLKDDDTIVEAMEPKLFDLIMSWSTSDRYESKWWDNELFDYILENFIVPYVDIPKKKCEKIMMELIERGEISYKGITKDKKKILQNFYNEFMSYTKNAEEEIDCYDVYETCNKLKHN